MSFFSSIFDYATNLLNMKAQQQENALTRQREDTAFSRAATDLENAGLSKTLAVGNPAPTSALNAPQLNFSMTDHENATMSQLANAASIATTGAQIGNINANTNLVNAQAAQVEAQTKLNNLDLAYYNKFNLSPAQNSTLVKTINGVVNEASGGSSPFSGFGSFFSGLFGFNGSSSADASNVSRSTSPTTSPSPASPSSSGSSSGCKLGDSSITWDKEDLEENGYYLWNTLGESFNEFWDSLSPVYTQNLRFDPEDNLLFLQNHPENYFVTGAQFFEPFITDMMSQTGFDRSSCEIALRCMILYGVEHEKFRYSDKVLVPHSKTFKEIFSKK